MMRPPVANSHRATVHEQSEQYQSDTICQLSGIRPLEVAAVCHSSRSDGFTLETVGHLLLIASDRVLQSETEFCLGQRSI